MDALQRDACMAEENVADGYAVDEIDRNGFSQPVLLDRRPVRVDGDDACFDGCVATRDARIHEQPRMLEEDVDVLHSTW